MGALGGGSRESERLRGVNVWTLRFGNGLGSLGNLLLPSSCGPDLQKTDELKPFEG